MPNLRMTKKRAALMTYLWRNRDVSTADLRAAGFTRYLVDALAGLRLLKWDPRTTGYRLTRSGQAAARRVLYTLAA